ncbi:methyltransferase domain-containing protein [Saccharothrix luteola]|uniref:methyltransferase domain-containing protein n=1 Tax=Saccharothrix luteola TaxID=2893018 RepID=UPI001E354B3F|nr:methyltransferase domain-containing protein [Saccharothrix luteola]MCC8250535.1 methyltransferase domain-containing protein [Saccharothrix luteola]
MVDQLHDMGAARSDAVIAALSRVPRHLFGPGEPLDKAYAVQGTLLTKWNDEGEAVSTGSAPHIRAMMLEPADIQPGMRVLEIGSGGYNAALIAELVGPTGQVITVDIDPEVMTRARACLTAAGYHAVNAVEADAEHGVPRHAPFDRIIVTVAAWDLPRASWEQLVEDGRIVVRLGARRPPREGTEGSDPRSSPPGKQDRSRTAAVPCHLLRSGGVTRQGGPDDDRHVVIQINPGGTLTFRHTAPRTLLTSRQDHTP